MNIAHPNSPRPPQSQINAVLADLPNRMASLSSDPDSYISLDAIVQALAKAHCRPAIDWTFFLLLEQGMLVQGTVEQVVKTSDAVRGISQIRSRQIQVPAMKCTSEFWTLWKNNKLQIQSQNERTEFGFETGLTGSNHIALCLSGGGFRATLYHLGVIRFLRDAGLLKNVRHICAVSGGSIAAAHVVRHWARYTSDIDEDFDSVARELIKFVKQDVRGKIVRRLPFSFFRKSWRRSNLICSLYESLYATRSASPQTPLPKLHLLATNLTLGCLCSFEEDSIILFKNDGRQELKTSTLTDAVKVTASSAFPAFFPPVALTADDLGVNKQEFLPDIQYFTDGGVYDNLGIRRLQDIVQETDNKPDERLALLLASDAGRPFGINLTRSSPGIIKTAWRSNDVALARIGELDRRELSNVFDLPHSRPNLMPDRFRVLSIGDEVPFIKGGNTLPINIQKLTKAIRTDLDRFSDTEIVFLVQHGYECTRKSLETLSHECEIADPKQAIVRLIAGARKVKAGRWLPPDTDPGWPRDKDATVWDDDPDKTKLTQSIAKLRHSGEIRWRLFSAKDPVSIFSASLLLAVVVALGVLGWISFRVDRSVSPILYSSLGGILDNKIFEVDPSMPGIEVFERLIEVDLRNEVPVLDKNRDILRVSPSVHTYTINGVRRSTSSRYLVYEFSSQRELMDLVCITNHPFQVRYRQDPVPGGDGFDNVYTIIVDLDQHSPDIPFNVMFRVTRWNAYQSPNKNFVGTLVSADEIKVRLNVLLPLGKKFVKATHEERPQQKGTTWAAVDKERIIEPVPTPERDGFSWILQNPRKGWAQRVIIEWE